MSRLYISLFTTKVLLLLSVIGFMISVLFHFLLLCGIEFFNRAEFDIAFSLAFLVGLFPLLIEYFHGMKSGEDIRKYFINVEHNKFIGFLWLFLLIYVAVLSFIEILFDARSLSLDFIFNSCGAIGLFIAGMWYHSTAIKIHKNNGVQGSGKKGDRFI